MINDEVKAVGQMPSKGMFKKWLMEDLTSEKIISEDRK